MKAEQQAKQISIVCITLMVILATILAIRLSLFTNGCPSCFGDSLFNKLLVYTLTGVLLGYIACIPIMIYKVRQSKKGETADDCDEGSCSY